MASQSYSGLSPQAAEVARQRKKMLDEVMPKGWIDDSSVPSGNPLDPNLAASPPLAVKETPAMGGPDADEDLAVDLTTGGADTDDSAAASLAVGPSSAGDNRSARLEKLLGQQQQSLSALYDKAAARLQERYRGPTQNELLLSLGSAFLQPTEGGSFMESFANVPGALAGYAKAKREAADTIEDKMMELDIGKAKELNDLYQRYLTSAYKSPRTAIDPTTGMVLNLDTAEPVLPPGTPVLKGGDQASYDAYSKMTSGTLFYDADTRQLRRKK